MEKKKILDDDYIIKSHNNHQIYIDLQAGLRREHIIPAIKILNGELNFYYDYNDSDETPEERNRRMNEKLEKYLERSI